MAASSVLDADEAYAIASAWHPQLQCQRLAHRNVRLHADYVTGNDFAFVKSYEWIAFNVRENEELASDARAATLTWFWLSCCRGYSAKENPSFWCRIFCELQRPHGMAATHYSREWFPDLSITGANGFFTQHEFPRVKVCTDNVIVAQVFMGMRRWQDTARDSKLRDLLTRLRPFMDSERQQRTIPVGLFEDEKTDRTFFNKVIRSLSGSVPPDARGVVPQFTYHSTLAVKQGLANREKIADVFDNLPVIIPSVDCGPHQFKYFSRRDIALRLRSLFSISGHRAYSQRVRLFCIGQFQDSKDARSAVWSVMPHSQSVDTLRLLLPRSLKEAAAVTYSKIDWAWLGYALFHPLNASSAWRTLELKLHDLPAETLSILQLMATGNNFLSALRDSTKPSSTAYYRATLRSGATVGVSTSNDADSTWKLDGDSTVYLEAMPSPSSGEFLRVVVPGFSFGWVKASDIISIDALPPGKPFLERLKLHVKNIEDVGVVAGLIGMIGAKLTHLDIADCGEIDAALLHTILTACSSLTSLRVAHDGSLWSRTEMPQLKELVLVVAGCLQLPVQLTKSPLRHLTKLRIYTKQPMFSAYRDSVVALLQSHPQLRYFHWSDQEYRDDNMTRSAGRYPFTQAKQRVHQLLQCDDAPWMRSALKPLSVRQRAAWLSAVSHQASLQSALGRLGRDLSNQVLEFAAAIVPRTIWIGA